MGANCSSATKEPAGKDAWVDPVKAMPVPTLTSTVYEGLSVVSPKTAQNFAEHTWSMPHECIRHELIRIDKMVDCMSGSGASVKAFLNYFEKYVAIYLHGHHTAEDNVMFKAVSEKIELPSFISGDHSALDNVKTIAVIEACKGNDFPKVKEYFSSFVEMRRGRAGTPRLSWPLLAHNPQLRSAHASAHRRNAQMPTAAA